MRDDLRRALARAVGVCRRALSGDRANKEVGDIGATLEAPYGFDPSTGAPKPMEQMTHLRASQRTVAEMLREWHRHLMGSAAGSTEAERARAAYDEMKYEAGYTVVHRLCALRMAEEREIVRECVRQGLQSEGFRLYLRVAGPGLGAPEQAYPVFLNRLYDELCAELPAVFDRRSAASLLVPSPRALDAVLGAINTTDIAPLWGEDETLGWIFEEYNDPKERQEMREHDAPRNARELSVRNQFFTPRWVVEFLTDNTLGRLWWELSGGETSLSETCRFLLKPKEAGARAPRDPRSLKVLDPACGSGHFLLYVFDLFEKIYAEAWEGRRQSGDGLTPLWEEFEDIEALRRAIPSLVLAHNLYGVDIDARCIQEAGLSLWLRAHRSWKERDVKAKDRPALRKMNLVTAQALPNDEALKKRARDKLHPPFLGKLVDGLFVQVGEMGVLLRAETAIADKLAEVKKEYLAGKQGQRGKSGVLFEEFATPRQTTLEELAEVQKVADDEGFWREAEEKILGALASLAEEEGEKEHYRSRLFAEAMRHAVEFFDVSRIKYDVVLMNPPFGVPTEGTKGVLDAAYPNCGHDLYAMFYERALEMLADGGRVGGITNRTWLALPTLAKFRQDVLGKKGSVEFAADLGYGVLSAKVETVAAVLGSSVSIDKCATWVRLVKTGRKEETLLKAVMCGESHATVSSVPARQFESLPSGVYGYWMSRSLASTYRKLRTIGSSADVRQGTATADDFRFLRLTWEVVASTLGLIEMWARFAKGGESRAYFDDIHLVLRWANGGREVVAWGKGRPQNIEHFGRRGITWPRRTNLRISPRVLPAGCAFGDKGPSALLDVDETRLATLSVLCSAPTYLLLSIRFQTADDSPNSISKSYEVGLIRDLPWPALSEGQSNRVGQLALQAAQIVRLGQIEDDDTGESVVAFALPPVLLPLPDGSRAPSLRDATLARVAAREDRVTRLAEVQAEIDSIVADAYGFSERDRQVMDEELEPPLASLPGTDPIDEAQFRKAYLTKEPLDGERLPGGNDAEMDVRVEHRRKKQVKLRDEATLCRLFQAPPARIAELRRRLGLLRKEDLHRAAADILGYAVGVAFGRWDVRLFAHPEHIPTFADPFDPLPPCPLGQLVHAGGLPATEDHITSEAWLAARKDPTKLPEGPAETWEIGAAHYPLPVAWDGLLLDDILDDDAPRRPSGCFLSRVSAVLDHLFGEARVAWEHDLREALGVASLDGWLREPKHFFADHLDRYSKSRRQAPLYWPVSTPSGGLVAWIYAPRFHAGTLPLVINRLRVDVEILRDERDRLRAETKPESRGRLGRLEREIPERQALHDELERLLAWGYAPHPDDGFVITASPLHFAFRWPRWRDSLIETWALLQKGDLDWAHLALRLRGDKVLEKCKTNLSYAIAHGREDLYSGDVPKKRGRRAAAPPDAPPPGAPPAAKRGASAKRGARARMSAAPGQEAQKRLPGLAKEEEDE